MKKAFTIIAAVILLAPMALAEFSLKIGGGFTTIPGGDYNKGMKGFVDYSRAYSTDWSGTYDGNLSGLSSIGMNFFVEGTYNFTPNIGVGLGAGYFQTQAKEDSFFNDGVLFVLWWAERTVSNSATLSVIPITLNVHYTLPLSSTFNLDVFAGPGLYLTNFTFEDETDFDAWLLGIFHTDDYHATTDYKASKTAFGFQGGLGLEFNVSPSIAIFLNGLFRVLTVSDIKGDWDYVFDDNLASATATASESDFYLWYYELYYNGTDYPHLMLSDTAPSGAGISSARHAKFSLTGVCVAAGIKIRFGSI